MTQEHPITPPEDLVEQIRSDALDRSGNALDYAQKLIHAAYRAGADQELEACCEWLKYTDEKEKLRAARRPKPKSLKEQALKELKDWTDEKHGPGGEVFLCEGLSVALIREALESLTD